MSSICNPFANPGQHNAEYNVGHTEHWRTDEGQYPKHLTKDSTRNSYARWWRWDRGEPLRALPSLPSHTKNRPRKRYTKGTTITDGQRQAQDAKNRRMKAWNTPKTQHDRCYYPHSSAPRRRNAQRKRTRLGSGKKCQEHCILRQIIVLHQCARDSIVRQKIRKNVSPA